MGISINPLLAKLASDLHKPHSINILYPWRSSSLLASMPLRKIPDAGHRTIQLLKPVLEQFHSKDTTVGSSSNSSSETIDRKIWTCRDLLRLPKAKVKRVLERYA